ncbi:MAG: sulfite oxidase-like oxidoreductase [Chloroflexia bacterium]|nr:sulfite oxidase-like oxidoreductase [Chloroflexia bacterium]
MTARARSVRKPALREADAPDLPPGQFPAKRWTVLHQGEVPRFDPATWDLRLWGEVERPVLLSWPEFAALPTVERVGDLHCVSRWSKLDNRWRGVDPRELARIVGPRSCSRHVVLHGEGGYTANLPLEAFLSPDTILATHHDDRLLTAEHGAPLRAVVPERYAWKSVKWLRGVEFLAADRPGFWEGFGFSNSASVWAEERFAAPAAGEAPSS